MTDKPIRIQRKRTKGWRKPPDTVYVGRGSKWGNPFRLLNEEGFPLLDEFISPGNYWEPMKDWEQARTRVVELFRERCTDTLPNLSELRGKKLACWCPLDQPCHADVLLELANLTAQASERSAA
jgi:hypothetical protein